MPKISDLPADTAPDSADLIPFVDVTAARTESVTVANLAASAAFSGQYAPLASPTFTGTVVVPDAVGDTTEALNVQTADARFAPLGGVDQISIPAVLWTAGEGTPAITQIGTSAKAKGWAHDAATDESITYPIVFPAHWSTYNMDLWWKNGGAGAGDVRWVASQAVAADGGDIDPVPGDGEAIVATAPTGDIAELTRVQTNAPITSGALHTLVLNRDANNAADTLANDCLSVLLVLTRES